jgi:hypothetical protein
MVTNPITTENAQPGNPASEWDISGAGDSSIQGFATEISVNRGETIQFKIKTNATRYRLDIYRMGYYNGLGARKITTVSVSRQQPQNQPACQVNQATGLVDCGNWAVSASWTVPADVTSGIYFAKVVRPDTGAASHIVFIVRDDASQSDILFQASDTTWQAYNNYGDVYGPRSLYVGTPSGVSGSAVPGINPTRAYKVSYNRPFNTRSVDNGQDWLFNAEYPMVRWLEANGYDVSYFTGVDSDRRGNLICNHKVLLSVGHDEYWSAQQRANVEAARNAGVHLVFFSGNEVFWKIRWENSIDASNTPYRTLVCYKQTFQKNGVDPNAVDPQDPPTWTGTWRDPRCSASSDCNRPENAFTGTLFKVNEGTVAIKVPAADGKMRFWRNTDIANLAPNDEATLSDRTLGYEWDEDLDNGVRPPGLIRLSTTVADGVDVLQDFGGTYARGTATHHLTLYKHSSGALVFGAGTIQWSWGLDGNHDRGNSTPDRRMQQATVNLLADMGVQPATLQTGPAGLVPATASTDTTAPTSTITAPSAGATIQAGSQVIITGTASDAGGGVVGGIEVSTDNGITWHPANGRTSWTYAWQPSAAGTATLKSRAADDSGNLETPGTGVAITVAPRTCPCSIWDAATQPDAIDPEIASVELGVKFQSSVDGFITGLRFYKDVANTGTHTGTLWTDVGQELATAAFVSETPSGWQQVNFANPIAITANTTYVASYHTDVGRYGVTTNAFATAGFNNPPLRALSNEESGGNGVYRYGPRAFPTETFQASNYWVDVVFVTTVTADVTPPTIVSVTPANNATGISTSSVVTAVFSEAIAPATVNSSTFELRNPSATVVPASVTYDATSRQATLQPTNPLATTTQYTAQAKGGTSDPRIKDLADNALASSLVWSFTTAGTVIAAQSIWGNSAVPAVIADAETNAVEVGVKFRSTVSGFITGICFYKSPANTGTHTGTLWTSTGQELATTTFTNETPSGWQQATFATPVAITANTIYVASYHTDVGRYSIDEGYFAASFFDNSPLRALKDGDSGGNGVYRYGLRSFPTDTYRSSNYWVDIVFATSV